MDKETILYLALVILGLIFVIAVMALVINPPESLVKRAFQGPQQPKRPDRKS